MAALPCAGAHGVCLSQEESFAQILEGEEGASHEDTLGRQRAQGLLLNLEQMAGHTLQIF